MLQQSHQGILNYLDPADQNCRYASAGGYFDRNHRETPLSQLHTYKAVYAAVKKSIDQGGMLKGILFWRWAGVDPTIDMSSENEATTLGNAFSCPQHAVLSTIASL